MTRIGTIEAGGGLLHRPRPLQPDQRHAGPRCRRPAAPACRGQAPRIVPRARRPGRRPPPELMAPEVARLGGDEFTVIMPGLTDSEDAAQAGPSHPLEPGASDPRRRSGVFVNASIGIAIYPFDGEDLETLLMHADTAMYKAKEQGGSSYQTYSRSMNATALAAAHAGERPPACARARRVRGALPADRGRPHGRCPERRGAGSLAPSGSGPAAARRVHPARRGERTDRAAGRMGASNGLRAEP